MRNLKYVLASCFTLAACSEAPSGPQQQSVVPAGNVASAILTNDVQRDVPAGFVNPCNEEQIIGTARIHVRMATTDTESGNSIANVSITLAFNGVGQTSGISYTGQTRKAFKYSYGTHRATQFSVDSELRVISQGSAQNFTGTARVHVAVDANGTPTAESELVKAECRG